MVHFLTFRILPAFVLTLLSTVIVAQSSNPVGDAYITSENCYTITPATNWQLGAVWFNEQLDLSEDFDITLTVNLGNNPAGADGIVMVFQQVGINALGEPGGGIGFTGFQPSLGIEIDTFQNLDFGDLASDHIAILQNGIVNHTTPNNLAGPTTAIPGGVSICDGQDHIFRVTWQSAQQVLSVYIDCNLRLNYQGDIVNDIFGTNSNVWWGFTGATGGANNLQTACISNYAIGLPEQFDICLGESVELGVVGAPNGSFEWSPVTYLDDPSSATPTATPLENTSYTVTFTDLCGEITQLSTSIDVTEVEVTIDDFENNCEGDPVSLSASGNAETFTWSNGQTGNEAQFSQAGNYTVTGSLGNCSATAEAEVLFFDNPELDLADEYTLCEGEPLTVDPGNSSLTYTWSDGSTSDTFTTSTGGNYSVTASSENGCEGATSFVVTFFALPVSELDASYEFCEGEVFLLNAGMADSFTWSTGETTSSIEIEEGGIYSVEMDVNGCLATFESAVIVNPLPVFAFISDFELCMGEDSTIALPTNDLIWRWNGSIVTNEVNITAPGIYTLEGTDVQNGCSSSLNLEVTSIFAPVTSLPEQLTLCEGEVFRLDSRATLASDVSWSTGATTPMIDISEPGNYSVVASNVCGTSESQTTVEQIRCDCKLFVPNAFTPDLDGINELFVPVIDCALEEYHFSISNRWGETIFESTEPGEGWNGSAPGRTHWALNDIYVWKLKYKADVAGKLIAVNKLGHVILLR